MSFRMRVLPPILRLLPPGAADLRAANLVYRRWFAASSRQATVTLDTGPRLTLDLSDWPQACAFLLGRYDVASVEFVVGNLPSRGVFVDAGAHVGLISLQVAMRRPQAQIHSFEPHPVRGGSLITNVRMNPRLSVEINRVGLSDRPGELSFDTTAHRAGVGDKVISVVTLDDYAHERGIERIDVLKLDIEGHEAPALRGARRLLAERRIGAVIVESLPAHGDVGAVAAYLLQHGFHAVDLPDPRPRCIRALRSWQPADTGHVLGAPPGALRPMRECDFAPRDR